MLSLSELVSDLRLTAEGLPDGFEQVVASLRQLLEPLEGRLVCAVLEGGCQHFVTADRVADAGEEASELGTSLEVMLAQLARLEELRPVTRFDDGIVTRVLETAPFL